MDIYMNLLLLMHLVSGKQVNVYNILGLYYSSEYFNCLAILNQILDFKWEVYFTRFTPVMIFGRSSSCYHDGDR